MAHMRVLLPALIFLPAVIAIGTGVGERFQLKDSQGRTLKISPAGRVKLNSGTPIDFFTAPARSDATNLYNGTQYFSLKIGDKYMRHQNYVAQSATWADYDSALIHHIAFDFAWKIIDAGNGNVKLFNDFGGGWFLGYDAGTDELKIVNSGSTNAMLFTFDNSRCSYPHSSECGAGRWCHITGTCQAAKDPGAVCLVDEECKEGGCCSGFCGGQPDWASCAANCACKSGTCEFFVCSPETCTFDSLTGGNCGQGRWCDIMDSCQPEYEAGHACFNNYECKSGVCCAGFCGGHNRGHFCVADCACFNGCSWFTCN